MWSHRKGAASLILRDTDCVINSQYYNYTTRYDWISMVYTHRLWNRWRTWKNRWGISYETTVQSLVDTYSRAENWCSERQILSIVAADLSPYLLKSEFPEVTDWIIKVVLYAETRWCNKHVLLSGVIHSNTVGSYHLLYSSSSYRDRHTIRRKKTETRLWWPNYSIWCYAYYDSISNLIAVPYLLRTDDWWEHLQAIIFVFIVAILRNCAASTRKSLSSLDNFASDGSNAFEQFSKLCDKIATFGKYDSIQRLL